MQILQFYYKFKLKKYYKFSNTYKQIQQLKMLKL